MRFSEYDKTNPGDNRNETDNNQHDTCVNYVNVFHR